MSAFESDEEVEEFVWHTRASRQGPVGFLVAAVRRLETLPPDHPAHADLVREVQRMLPAMEDSGVFEVFAARSPVLRDLLAGREGSPR